VELPGVKGAGAWAAERRRLKGAEKMYVANVLEVAGETVEEGAVGVRIKWMIDKHKGAPNFALRHFTVAPGGHTPRHKHAWEHEVYILSGTATVTGGEQEHRVKPGDCLLIPPEELHQFRNTGTEPLEFLCLVPNDSY